MKRLGAVLIWVSVAFALTGIFWAGFYRGQGLIGGDLYTYFYPQKVFYAERLAAGEFPLWNHWAGHGYPLVAESQTGALYPPNYIAYRLLSVNGAYNLVQLLHYVLAFLFTVAWARALGLSIWASALAGIIFVYGWFPARISLEWAIVTGAWMPAALWSVEKFLTTKRLPYALTLAVVLAWQMLPGHFHLAFITQVLVLGYIFGRFVWLRVRFRQEFESGNPAEFNTQHLIVLGLAVAFGFLLAAVQLLPTWELKTLSQRSTVGTYYDPGYGHIPVWYWTQIIAPFAWYGTGADLNAALPPGAPPTNPVEAHLYFGLIPVAFLCYGVWTGVFWRDHRWRVLGLLGLLALIFTTGWLLPMAKWIPGFTFFRGVGRWGIITTIGAAMLAGAALDEWLSKRRGRTWVCVVVFVVIAGTICDLRMVRGLVGDGFFVSDPPINSREQSTVRKLLAGSSVPVRLFCRGANLATLLGVSSTPEYLGIGPDAYFDPQTAMPGPLPFDEPPTQEQIDWLQRAGVTHILSFSALDERGWPVEFLWEGYDPMLSRAWARGPGESFWLYLLQGTRGRVAWLEQTAGQTAHIIEHPANRVLIEANSETGGTLILTELAYPGWTVTVDGMSAEPLTIDGMYRGVEVPPGEHRIEWRYAPRSFAVGIWISGGSAILLLLCLAASSWGKSRGRSEKNG